MALTNAERQQRYRNQKKSEQDRLVKKKAKLLVLKTLNKILEDK